VIVINLYEFVVSADEIEKLTGIDFIRNLRMELEYKLEKSSDYKDWSLAQIEMESNFIGTTTLLKQTATLEASVFFFTKIAVGYKIWNVVRIGFKIPPFVYFVGIHF
jgi:hypothetical protein